MDNYLFIGGAGFIGSAVIRQLLLKDSPTVIVLEKPSADISRLRDCHVTIVRGELSDTDMIDRLIVEHRITRIIHLVSTMTPSSGYDDYLEELRTVVRPTIRLLDVCVRRDVQIVYFSSCAIYGNGASEPIRENEPLAPISYYGLSKLLIETNIRFNHRTDGLRYLILRPSNPFGPGQRTNAKQGIVAVAVSKSLLGHPFTVYGDGSAVRDYIYIDDMAKAVCAVMRADKESEAVNIGSSRGYTVNDILAFVGDVVPSKLTVQHAGSRKNDVSSIVLDTSRMREFYHMPLTPIREGIRNFYRSVPKP